MALPITSSENTTLFPADARTINGSARRVWHKSAPQAVRRAFSSGDHLGGWRAWQRHLSSRKRPADPAKLLPADGGALSWALPDGLDPPPGPPWLDRAEKLLTDRRAVAGYRIRGYPPPPADPPLERDLLSWLGESAGADADAGYALETLACCRAITRLATLLSPEVWWALLDHLLADVADAQRLEPDDDPLVHQLLAGEAALTLAYLLPEITPCRKLKSAARRAISSGLVDLLDGVGLPHGKHLGLLRPLLACWTRCRAMGGELKGGCWTKTAGSQYEWLVCQALRLARHDGSQVFSRGSAGAWCEGLFAASLRFGGDQDDHDLASLVLPRVKQTAKQRADELALPEPAAESEWAALAVLRPGWSRSGERLTVVYPQRQVHIELGCGKDVLFSGVWELEVRIDGQPVLPDSDWEQLCWVSDEDADFLELEIELCGGTRVQRTMLLARQGRFLLLADAVLGERPGRLEYRGCLPLCPGISFQGDRQSREGFLSGSKRRALVLPLALPEWRDEQPRHTGDGKSGPRRRGASADAIPTHRAAGQLVQTPKGLELRQSTRARRLYAPLFIDLDRGRMTRRRTWRQLTVAESLAAVPDEVAVGYRVAVGKEQWLMYRSLAEKANRTLLGHNLSTETLVAQFHRSGEVEPLLEIE